MYRYGELTFSYSFFSVWTHKLRFLAKLLHIPKRAKNAIFYRKFRVFPVFSFFFVFFVFFVFSVFSVCFETVCFGCFATITKQRVSMFGLNWNKQETHPNSLKESIFGYFSEHLGLFRFVSVCYETVLFVSVVSIYIRNTETNRNFLFLVSRNKPKQTRNRSCFGLFRFEPKFIFVCFEDTLIMSNNITRNACNCRDVCSSRDIRHHQQQLRKQLCQSMTTFSKNIKEWKSWKYHLFTVRYSSLIMFGPIIYVTAPQWQNFDF
jgi:hypothetical protein